MEELAGIARMGASTFHHQFRALTAMSPLQYQKQLRLQAARQRMLTDGIDATNAGYEVGYESISQLSREYSRLFGQPPMRDVRTLRMAALTGSIWKLPSITRPGKDDDMPGSFLPRHIARRATSSSAP
jgi:AraC-like DNA-binding protein